MRFAILVLIACVAWASAEPVPAQQAKVDQALRDGKAAYDAGDVDRAIEILTKANPRGDNVRIRRNLGACYQQRGRGRYVAGKLESALRDYRSAYGLTPKNESALQSIGVISHKLRRMGDAETFMHRVLKINPDNTNALTILGLIARQRDNNKLASKYLSRAAALAPDREDYQLLAKKYGAEAEVEKRFVTLLRGNFRVQFERGRVVGVENAVRTVHAYLEQSYRDLGALFGARPGRRITVVVYNGDQYKQVNTSHTWAKAYYDGKLRVAVKKWPAGKNELRQDLRHELTHAFLHELHKNTPLWLHEGLAQVMEGRKPTVARAKFRSGVYKLLPLKTFTGRFADSPEADVVHRGYAQSLMLVGYLQRLGNRRQIQSLLREISRGTDPDKALRIVYRRGIEELVERAMR